VSAFLGYTIIGIASAAIYAVVASGLVLTYTTTGVFNFAHGAVGMIAAFAFWQLHVSWGWPSWAAAIVILIVLSPLAGLVMEWLMRWMEGTSETTKLIVSIALLFGLIGAAQTAWNPQAARSVDQFFPGRKFSFAGTSLTYHQLIVILVAVVVALALRQLLYGTRAGIAMRAVVDDRSLTQLNGVRAARVTQLSWTLGIGLAALGGILIASTAGLNAITLSLLIVNAYAAAIFGRLRSLPMTFVGALVVGLAESYAHGYSGNNQYLVGLQLAAPVIVLFLVLLAMPASRLRGLVRTREYFPAPKVSSGIVWCAMVLLGGVMLATTLRNADLVGYGKIFPYAIVALSLVPLLGFANQVSLCQFSLAGIGAVAYAHYGHGGNPMGLIAAVLIAAVVGALIALPALRLSGIYLALATAAFAVALDRWIFVLPDFTIGGQHFSIFGLGSVQADPLKLGWRFDTGRSQMILTAVVFVLCSLVVLWIRSSGFGRRLVAARDSEAACATLGMGLVANRLAVFTISAAIAGLGGALLAMQAGSANAQDYQFANGLPIFLLLAAGGAGFLSGGLFAGVVIAGVQPVLAVFFPWWPKWQWVLVLAFVLSLGREPSGAAPQFSVGFRNLINDFPVRWTMVAAMVAAWLLRLGGVFGNWTFVIVLAVLFVIGVAVSEVRAYAAGKTLGWSDPGMRPTGPPPTPLEWVGLAEPWTADLLAEVDEALALDEFGAGSTEQVGVLR
jgi:branched-chain amino acid transport system permease protein